MTTLLRGGLVLHLDTLDFAAADILIDGDTRTDIVPPGSVCAEGKALIEAADTLVIPGLVNGHNHAQSNLAKGLAERLEPHVNQYCSGLAARPWHVHGFCQH